MGACSSCQCIGNVVLLEAPSTGAISFPLSTVPDAPIGCLNISQYRFANLLNNTIRYSYTNISNIDTVLQLQLDTVQPGSIISIGLLIGRQLNSEIFVRRIDSSAPPIVAVTTSLSLNGKEFSFTVGNGASGLSIITFCFSLSQGSPPTLNSCVTKGNNVGAVPLPPSPINPCAPAIRGLALGTPDEKQICSFVYSVTEQSTPECPSCFDQQVKDYTFYCQDLQLATVMKGTGCTFVDKVMSLDLDVSAFVQYALLRTVLSQQLFGCFDIQFLRQRYYQNFLKELQKSKFSYYLMFLEAPYTVKNYWQFFKK